ncbi:hypothetical protein F444_10373 [Phytophthora nicotianae P1976]|uniref:Uncharacterized protein n=1 Tax=Phytophthora nicotianae P1976 TaxID=1317066 RepID=A0A081A487_PHYNI|nr:hypothetical protein F444_10373 [Phytophthora nicotianae P1976]
MGTDVIRRTKAQPEQFKRYMNNLHAQILMMFVYPIYEVLFRTAQGSHYQLFVILLLPIIKVVIKNIMRKCTMHAEDMVPEAVIFTVDFFNAIYVATCMQTASSAVSIVIIVLTDLSQTIIMLYGLHRRTAVISSALTQTVQKPHKDQFLSVLCELCRNPEIFKKQLRAVMVHLPSSKYHTEMVGITAENVGARISPVFMFGLLQIASLLLLLVTIKRNCLMRALYQLAFVLESQKLLVQTKLIVWMMITLCFRVMHFACEA